MLIKSNNFINNNFIIFFNNNFISTDEDPGLRIESFAIIRGVSTKLNITLNLFVVYVCALKHRAFYDILVHGDTLAVDNYPHLYSFGQSNYWQ